MWWIARLQAAIFDPVVLLTLPFLGWFVRPWWGVLAGAAAVAGLHVAIGSGAVVTGACGAAVVGYVAWGLRRVADRRAREG